MSRVRQEIGTLGKLEARRHDRAVRVSSVQRVAIDTDAFIISPLKMAGEGRLWAVAFGRRGEEPIFVSAPDARNRDDENALVIAPLGAALDRYFRECAMRETAPQVWVSSPSAVAFLDTIADRRGSKEAAVALLGLRAHFLTDRYWHAGQQVLLAATEVLAQHFATGQSVTEDQHLGSFLAWIAPPPGMSAVQAALAAEDVPAAVHTDPALDERLSTLLGQLAEMRRKTASPRRRAAINAEVEAALSAASLHVFSLIEGAIDAIERQRFEPVAGIDSLRQEDQRAFDFYMRRTFVPLRASSKEAARLLEERERAIGRAASVFLGRDVIERSVALGEGEIVHGVLSHVTYGPKPGSVHQVEITTDQAVSKLRVGDKVKVDAAKNIVLQLVAQRPGSKSDERLLDLRVETGKTSIEALLNEEVALLPSSGGGFRAAGGGHQITPWVLDTNAQVPARAQTTSGDPLVLLETLR